MKIPECSDDESCGLIHEGIIHIGCVVYHGPNCEVTKFFRDEKKDIH